MITNRVLRFLQDKAQKNKEEFDKFYKDYSIFFKEGIVSSTEQMEKVSLWFLYILIKNIETCIYKLFWYLTF